MNFFRCVFDESKNQNKKFTIGGSTGASSGGKTISLDSKYDSCLAIIAFNQKSQTITSNGSVEALYSQLYDDGPNKYGMAAYRITKKNNPITVTFGNAGYTYFGYVILYE